MRVTRLAQLSVAFVAIVACTPAKNPRTVAPSALSAPPDGAAPEGREAQGEASRSKPELGVGSPGTAQRRSRSSGGIEPDAATAAIAAENAARGPANRPPMWGDPVGIDVGAAASDLRTLVAPLVAPHEPPAAKKAPAAAETPPPAEPRTDGK